MPNFISPAFYDAMMRSIEQNEDETDEFAACGFTHEPCASIHAPQIAESFLTLECEFEEQLTPKNGAFSLIVGKTVRASVEEAYAHGIDVKYGPAGFSLNVHSPIDVNSGLCDKVGLATLCVDRTF